jgi:hypothetical protein
MNQVAKSVVLGLLMASAFAEANESQGSQTVVAESSDLSKVAARFQGSTFSFDQSISSDTLSPNSQLSPIPSYQWWLSLRPRYYVTPKFSLRARLDLTIEWLNAAETTRMREAQIGDLWLEGMYQLPSIWGIASTIGARTVWGTSLEAREQTSVVKIGPVVGLSRAFRGTKVGDFALRLGMYGLGNIVQSTSGGTLTPYACTATDFAPTSCSQNTGAMNPRFTLVAALSGSYTPKWLPALSLNASYIVLDSWLYDLPQAALLDRTGGITPVPRSPDDTRFRQSQWLLVSVDYDVRKWLSLSLGYYCYRPILDPNGTYGNPFYSPGGNTRIFLTTIFNLDHLYDAVISKMRGRRSMASSAGIPTGLVSF